MTTVVSVAQGGTGSNSAALARTALGVPPSAAYDQANTARDQANTARTQANTGYDQANTARGQANTAYAQANAAYGQANSAYGQANAAYGAANTRLSASGGTLSGDLIITGNLTVSGNSTTLNTEILTVEDADVVLLSNVASTPALNAGIIVNRGTSTNTFLRWAENVDEWGWSDNGTTTYFFDDLRQGLITTNTTFGTVNTNITNTNSNAINAYAQANSAFAAANNRVLKAGDTMTGNLIVSGATINTATANITTIITGNVLTLGTGSGSNANIIFSANSAEDMRIDAVTGNIAIGVSNTSQRLYVGRSLTDSTNGVSTSANSYPISRFMVHGSGGGIRGLEIGGPVGGIDSPVYVKVADTSVRFSILNNAGTEQLTILNGGNVGVGTTSPGTKLDVVTSTEADSIRINNTSPGVNSGNKFGFVVRENGTDKIFLRYRRDGSGIAELFNTSDAPFVLGANNTEHIRITAAGNLGVGATNPQGKLTISNAGAEGIEFFMTGAVGNGPYFNAYNRSTGRYVPFTYYANTHTFYTNTGSTRAVDIDINGYMTVGTILNGEFGVFVVGGAKTLASGIPQYQIQAQDTAAMAAGVGGAINFTGKFTTGGSITSFASIEASKDNATTGEYGAAMLFKTRVNGGSQAEVMRLTSGGNVAIGTTTAGEKLSVNGAIESLVDAGGGASEGGQIVLRAPAGGNTRWNMDNYTNKFRIFREDDSNKANGAAFFHIINGGNVGIGTDNPSRRLHIVDGSSGANVDSTATQVVIENSADAGIHIMNPNGNIGRVMFGTPARMPSGLIRWDNTNNNFDFSTDKSGAYIRFLTDLFQERMRIVSGGAVGINYTNPAGYGQLTVNWDVTNTANNNGVGLAIRPAADTTDAYFALFFNSTGSGIGSIRRVGTTNAVAYNTSSDRRLKENIVPAQSASSIIDNIEVVQYDWKEGTHVRHGIIAQDLYSVAPEAVSVGDAEEIDSPRNPWGVDYSKLVPMLIKEIQELRARIATLELGNN